MASQESQPFHWHYTELDDHNFQIRGRTLFSIIVVFAVVLLASFLLLYARWFCRRFSHQNSNPDVPRAQQALTRGLDLTTINTLPIVLHRSEKSTKDDKEEESECCICLGVFEDGDKVKILPKCRHCYHCECVDAWLSARSSCPLCRNSLRVDSALPSITTQ